MPLLTLIVVRGTRSTEYRATSPGRCAGLQQRVAAGQPAPGAQPAVPLGGYQQLIRGEPFRGKFRTSFEKPVPFEPGKPDRITFNLPDVAHTFRQGHGIMVQIQSSWFPLTDRNPQKFIDIPKALPADFVKATERVYFGGADGSRITLRIAGGTGNGLRGSFSSRIANFVRGTEAGK